MTPASIDAYLQELRQALSERGREDLRIVDEAREHLVDAVQEGLRRGLDGADAEREAMERFGPPDVIAAQALQPRSRIMARLTTALDTIVGHWRWITAATALAALVTSVASYYLLPTRYRSEMVIAIVPNGLPPEQAGTSQARLHSLSQAILSRSRVMASDGRILVVEPDNIAVEIVGAERPEELRVSYQSPDPRLAMRITERVASMMIEESLRQRDSFTEWTNQSIDDEIDDVRYRLAQLELTLRVQPPSGVLRANQIPFEVMQDHYRDLLVRRENARSAASLERRAAGDQFKVVQGARVPDRPVGPSRASVNVAGALAGLMFSTVGLIWRRPT